MSSRRVEIFDTTLRDGEQSPGVNLTEIEKLEIAKQLQRLGVDVIEAGFAAASPGDFRSVSRIAAEVKGVTICSLARLTEHDIQNAYEALRDAEQPRIHVFLATSPIHMQHKLRLTPEQVMDRVAEGVRFAAKFGMEVQFSAEDAGRSELPFLAKIAEIAIQNGATIFNVPDTVGYLTPDEYAYRFRYLLENVPNIGRAKLAAHCHDDLGLAVANSLAALEAGCTQVEVAVNGIGERAGNAALEEVAMAIQTRSSRYGLFTGIDSSQITRTSRMVSRLTGMVIQPNKAIVGANAFAHESGIHQDGMLKEKTTYEIIRPETVGLAESRLVLGKHSGRHAFSERLAELGFDLTSETVTELFGKFKDLCDKKKQVTDEDLISLVDDQVLSGVEAIYRLEYLHISCGTDCLPTATIALLGENNERHQEAAVGNGAVDAIFKAIDRITDEKPELVLYNISAITGGADALGEVHIQLRLGEHVANGRGVSTDVLEASARAYLDAFNRIIQKKGVKAHA